MEKPRVVIVMGVAGSGKTTIGEILAARNGGEFHDADAFHPSENVTKMAAGTPLNDTDRAPWLTRLWREVVDATPPGKFCVLACSALKRAYREKLGVGVTDDVALVYLKGDAITLTERIAERTGHFMKAGMLESQLATLEEPLPEEGVTVDVIGTVEEIVDDIEAALGLRFPPRTADSSL